MLLYCLLLFSFISAGVGINDGLFLSKDCSACDNSLLLKLRAFWSGHVILGTSVTFLCFSRYNNFLWLLWCLRFDFLNLLVFRGWSKTVILSLWYFDCCFLKIVEDSDSFSFFHQQLVQNSCGKFINTFWKVFISWSLEIESKVQDTSQMLNFIDFFKR